MERLMRVISKKKLREFWEEYPDAEEPLAAWYTVARQADWENFAQVRAVYSSADLVGDCTVFNIGGNKYRLITLIFYESHRVYIREVLTHKEYDRGKWKEDCGA
jgi:mRNA interferase HigB